MVKKKPRVIWRGKQLRIAVSVELRYTTPILHAVRRMTDETSRQLMDLFQREFAQEHFHAVRHTVGMDAKGISAQARILLNKLKRQNDQLFGKLALGLSPTMANDVNRNSFATTSASLDGIPTDNPTLKGESQKLTISLQSLDKPTLQILNAATQKSANFITSIPETHLNRVSDAVFNSIATGNGLQDLIPFLEKQDNSITNWARNTALDQTRKAYTGLNIGRMNKIGISKGEWIHTGGSQHPRPLHEEFDGEVFDLSVGAPIGDDGENVMPSEEPNCRCSFAPVIVFDDDDTED